ncbi:MAG: YhgE/Pip family protein, partial [Bacillus sp. (in: firmicutes)]
ASGTGQLAQGSQKLAVGSKDLASGTGQLAQGSQKLAVGSRDLASGTGQLAQGSQKLAVGSRDLASGTGQLAQGSQKLAVGSRNLASGTTKLANGASDLVDGASQVADGNATLKGSWAQLSDGARKIDNGMTQVNEGNQTVKAGWTTLTDGVEQVDEGVAQIEGGSDDLSNGLKGGADKVNAIHADDQNIAQFASPVTLNKNVKNEFPLYRYANAPYILSLALFVGVLIMTVLFTIRKPEDAEVSSFTWYGTVFAKMAAVAVLQAVIMSVFVLFWLNLSISHSILLVLFSIIASLAFLSIVFFLVAAAGNVGRFAAVAFLILQLSTTGSSLPVDMLPSNLRALSQFLPMKYSNDSFRSIISLDSASAGWANVSILAIYIIVALALVALVAFLHSRKAGTTSPKEA